MCYRPDILFASYNMKLSSCECPTQYSIIFPWKPPSGILISDGSADPTAFSYQYHKRLPVFFALIHSNITKPLFFVNSLLPVDSFILEESILAIAGERDASRKDTVEGRLVAIIKEITDEGGFDSFIEWTIKTNDIRTRYSQGRPEDRLVSPQWIGKRLKSMSFHNRIVHGYSEIKITSGEYALILQQYGYTGRECANSDNSLPNSLPNKNEQDHDIPREVESCRESAREQAHLDSYTPLEREIYQECLEILKKQGGMSQEEMERIGNEYVGMSRKPDEILLRN